MSTPTTTPQVPPTDHAASPPRRKRSRWRRTLAIIVLVPLTVLVLGLALAPTIASQPAVTRFALGFVNDALNGDIELEKLSAGWVGPTELRGLRVLDRDGVAVVDLPSIKIPLGAWGLLTSIMNFQQIEIDSPTITLVFKKDGGVTLADALASRTPSPPSPKPSTLPAPRGRVLLKNATVHLKREGGAEVDIRSIDADIALATLSDIQGTVGAVLGDARVAAEVGVNGLVDGGAFSPRNAGGKLALSCDKPIDLAPISAVLAPDAAVRGAATIRLDGVFAPGQFDAKFKAVAAQISSAQAPQANPIDISIDGDASITNEAITAVAALGSQAGAANANLRYSLAKPPPPLTTERIAAALLAGDPLELPDFTLTADAKVDLAALERALPGLLKIREGQQVAEGTFEIEKLEATGGDAPTATVALSLRAVKVVSDGRTIQPQPITLGFNVALAPKEGLKIENAELKSSFAQLAAKGVPADLNARFSADLTQLQNELGQIVDFGDARVSGSLSGVLRGVRPSADKIEFTGDIDAAGVQYAAGGKTLDLQKGEVRLAAAAELKGGSPARLTASSIAADLDGKIVAVAAGWYDLKTGALAGDARVERADLAFVTTKATALTGADVGAIAGDIVLAASVERANGEQPMQSRGELKAAGLAVDGQLLSERETVLTWSGAALAPDFRRVSVEAANLDSDFATLKATQVNFDAAKEAALSAQVAASADLSRVMKLVSRLAKMEHPPQVAGQLTLNAAAGTAGGLVSLKGEGQVAGLAVGEGDQTFREERVGLDFDAALDPKAERVALRGAKITSAPFSAEVSGDITEYRRNATLNLKGQYDAKWEQLTKLLHQFAPATQTTIAVGGESRSAFTVTGPASKPEVRPTYRGVAGDTTVGWGSANVYGIAMSGATLAPKLVDGRLDVPLAAVSASGGQINLGGTVDLTRPDATYLLPGATTVIKGVSVNKLFAETVLTWLNPIFGQLTKIDGTMSLSTQDIVFPLGQTMKTAASGKGRLDMDNVQIQPGGLLGELLALGGLALQDYYTTTISGCDFVIADGRISYTDFTITFPQQFDLKFRGSVGFDSTLDLIVSVPIQAPLLERLGVRGPIVEYARMLAGSRVEIPIAGTRNQPKLDISKVNVDKLLENVVKKGVEDNLKGTVEDLLKGGGKDGKNEGPKLPPLPIPLPGDKK